MNKKWNSETSRRDFFDTFAKHMNFNPLDADRWYNVKQSDVVRHKVRTMVSLVDIFVAHPHLSQNRVEWLSYLITRNHFHVQ